MSRPSDEELQALETDNTFSAKPNIIIDIFKNRRGRWTQIRIWGHNDLGTCRRTDLFVTNTKNEPITDFSLIQFKKFSESEYQELLDFFNDGVVIDDDNSLDEIVNIVEASVKIHNEKSDDYIDSAFKNKVDEYKKVKDKSIGDFL